MNSIDFKEWDNFFEGLRSLKLIKPEKKDFGSSCLEMLNKSSVGLLHENEGDPETSHIIGERFCNED